MRRIVPSHHGTRLPPHHGMPPCFPAVYTPPYRVQAGTWTLCTPQDRSSTTTDVRFVNNVEGERPLRRGKGGLSPQDIPLLPAERGALRPRNPLQKAALHKDEQKVLTPPIVKRVSGGGAGSTKPTVKRISGEAGRLSGASFKSVSHCWRALGSLF